MNPFISSPPYEREPARFFAELLDRPFEDERLDDERPFEEAVVRLDDERPFEDELERLRAPLDERFLAPLDELALLRAPLEEVERLRAPLDEVERFRAPLLLDRLPLPLLLERLRPPLLLLERLRPPPLLLDWLWLLELLDWLCARGCSCFSIKTYALKRARSARTARFTWRMPRAAFSIMEPGCTSRLTSTRVRRGPSSWNVTTPACVTPSVTFHLMRSPGSFSTISARNSFEIPQIFVLNAMCSSSSWDTFSSRCMNSGHFSYSVQCL